MHDHLPRLAPEYYRGIAFVHWTMTVDQRATGWLDELIHHRFREVLLHTMTRYGLLCPAYCLMPDHVHFIWVGVRQNADQRLAAQFFRHHTNRLLQPKRWQKQSYDNVLGERERKADGFSKVCHYILENPVRAGLATRWEEYAYSGAMIAGFPTLSPRQTDYWDKLWRIYNEAMKQ